VGKFFSQWHVAPVPKGWVSANMFVRFVSMIIDVTNRKIVGYYESAFHLHLVNDLHGGASVKSNPVPLSDPRFTPGKYSGAGAK
jgi:hypothetical protein